MKKLLVLVFIFCNCFLFSGCSSTSQIYKGIYIGSMGIEKQDGEYIGYFMLPSSLAVGNTKSENIEDQAEIATVHSSRIANLISDLELSTLLEVNLKHISSMVLHESILNKTDIEELLEYFLSSKDFDFNFYIYSTKGSLTDIYSTQNPNKENVIFSMLLEPLSNPYVYASAKPLHYLNFCREYYRHKVISLPLVETADVWSSGEKSSVSSICRGITFYRKNQAWMFSYYEAPFEFLSSNKESYYSDALVDIIFQDYKVEVKYDDDVTIKVKTKYQNLFLRDKTINLKNYLEKVIREKIEDLIQNHQNEIDFLNMEFHYGTKDKDIYIEVNCIEK